MLSNHHVKMCVGLLCLSPFMCPLLFSSPYSSSLLLFSYTPHLSFFPFMPHITSCPLGLARSRKLQHFLADSLSCASHALLSSTLISVLNIAYFSSLYHASYPFRSLPPQSPGSPTPSLISRMSHLLLLSLLCPAISLGTSLFISRLPTLKSNQL